MLTVIRNGYRSETHRTREEYQAGVGAEFPLHVGEDGYVEIAFSTNPEGDRRQTYVVHLTANNFAEVAREMFRANPAEAIKAFGAAMQEFKDNKPKRPKSSALGFIRPTDARAPE
jgi:hypothetical protein